MFYAAVEEKLDLSLRERPFAVGTYAMLTTSNYIARTYGVRSGMPGFIAKKLCPSLWIRPPRFDLYRREAAEVRAIGAQYDPHYVAVGLDELTMDVTDYLRTHPDRSAEDVCAEFRRRVEEATQLTCSGGIAHTAAFAKLASNVKKPNGQHILALRTREEVLAYVRDMPVRDVPGIGFATEQRLHALGVVTCKDFLARKAELCYLFREKTFAFYLSVGLGLVRTHVDRSNAEREAATAPPSAAAATLPRSAAHLKSRPPRASASQSPSALQAVVPVHRAQKSTGKCVTLVRGVPSREAFWQHLRQLAQGAHDVLREQGTGTKHVCFYTTSRAFVPRSHAAMLSEVTNSFAKLYAALEKVAEPFAAQHREFRLIGVKFSKLQPLPAGRRSTKGKGAAPVCKTKVKVARHYPKQRGDAAAPAQRYAAAKMAKTPRRAQPRSPVAKQVSAARHRTAPTCREKKVSAL
ncbi:putative DNA polymerase kappa [Leishmania mexicana MHOM/GT/2001/U1103]|uniref:DNA polymerase kappa n=1 Tax=Leishmania mexicana (strain MHOM/GT/2001/U1103) TaxID=929439 RepID=E9AZW3_LEIMU|nr:putative DNA polymerase kappa [Leishmania mexicana MHOM/GT/2001/U1103]CBZ28514.1 putative DNA polymerase kappa [Leishmania mexicana MHOM/GT/2001/U1103]